MLRLCGSSKWNDKNSDKDFHKKYRLDSLLQTVGILPGFAVLVLNDMIFRIN